MGKGKSRLRVKMNASQEDAKAADASMYYCQQTDDVLTRSIESLRHSKRHEDCTELHSGVKRLIRSSKTTGEVV